MGWLKRNKPNLTCLDADWLPVTRRTPRPSGGPPPGEIMRTRKQLRSSHKIKPKTTPPHVPTYHMPSPEEIAAETAKIRRAKDIHLEQLDYEDDSAD